MHYLDTNKFYRHILILESREWWDGCSVGFDPSSDLVLTYDLALQREVTALGGQALYMDHLSDAQVMQRNNFRTYRFFRDWHMDGLGEDIFVHRGIPFGFAFRIEIWNDLLSYVLNRVNLGRLRELKFEQVLVGTESGMVESILAEMGIESICVTRPQKSGRPTYYFPIHRWMDEKVRTLKFRHKVMRGIITAQGILASWLDPILEYKGRRTRIFMQVYHPTRKILQKLKEDPNLRVVLGYFSPTQDKSKFLNERPIPIRGKPEKYAREADLLMRAFQARRVAKLILEDGGDISEMVYSIIEKRVSSRIREYLRDLDSVIEYMDRNPVQLEVMIANIGRVDTLVDCVCKKRGIPSFLIINGLMGPEYGDEGKYASVINAYSTNIRDNYFRGMNNIVCLGDPRMDDYSVSVPRELNRECPTVSIGASGFNIVDLNSYVAVEFEFLWDVLQALKTVKEQGVALRVVIKVRPNGYRGQYEDFAKEYFPGLVDEIQDTIPMRSVLEKTDLYISIYSQTLFEASCLGIPSIYYKKDTEMQGAPFDGNSELVTVDNVDDLTEAIYDFRRGHTRFNAFLQRSVMEKYIGFLDGKNVERNTEFVYQLLRGQKMEVEK